MTKILYIVVVIFKYFLQYTECPISLETGKNDENGLYKQIVFNVSTIMKDTQTQMRYPLNSDIRVANGVRSDDITC